VDQKLSSNKEIINQQKLNTQKTKYNLETKVDDADNSIAGTLRNEDWIGTSNQFVQNRNKNDKK